jgi:uncharacterized protein (TIGR02145 family)
MKRIYLIAIILLVFSVYIGCKKDDNNDGGDDVGGSKPCPETPTVTYEGQVYNTVLIGNQCWMAENLNVGTMINGTNEMTDDGVIEKYCNDNSKENCDEYGGLYQWNEMMAYTTIAGVRGICPGGWHLPTNDEWKILEGTVDSQYPVSDTMWNNSGFRGYDAGLNLKSTSGWYSGGNGSGLYHYEALPGGLHKIDGSFLELAHIAVFWSSSEYDSSQAWLRFLDYEYDKVCSPISNKNYGYSVRCLKD